MAWRIEDSVVRGEIDNRVRGRVTGRIWFAGRSQPMELNLTGNGWRDLAGRRLEFTNPHPTMGNTSLEGLINFQRGTVGDITASRKVKVPEIPMEQIGEYYAARKPFPWHWGNSLYLEWFSEHNGRVVIESAGYELKIIGEPAWEMTPEDEEAQRLANSAAITGFLEQLGETTGEESESGESAFTGVNEDAGEEGQSATWGTRPQTEAEAEKMQAEGERLVDRIHARIRREGENADYGKIMEEEIERMKVERGAPAPTPEQLVRQDEWIEEMNRAATEAAGSLELEEAPDREHPLAASARELSLQIADETDQRGWIVDQAGEEHPVAELVGSLHKASAKLAGALNGNESPPPIELCASIVVRLIKARVYLDDAVRAMESCEEQKLVEYSWLTSVLVKVTALAHEADRMIGELRARLARSTD